MSELVSLIRPDNRRSILLAERLAPRSTARWISWVAPHFNTAIRAVRSEPVAPSVSRQVTRKDQGAGVNGAGPSRRPKAASAH